MREEQVKIRLKHGWLHFYMLPSREAVHAYFGQKAAYHETFCGIDIPTGTLFREREFDESVLCEKCLFDLRWKYAKSIQEVEE